MRVCLVYDCLFPYTVGGAERRCRELAERLTLDGHEVTYLTLRQWEHGEDPSFAGVTVAVAGPRMPLYAHGRRRIAPPLVFGAGVFWHLLRHGRSYDVVHTVSFPYFSPIAASLLRRAGRYRLVIDWFEVWTRAYWEEYLGRPAGWLGWLVQRLCTRLHQRAFCFSRLHARRLREEGYRGEITILEGAYAGSLKRPQPRLADPLIVFAGRHIPEKRVPALIPAIARLRAEIPGLRCQIYGDGPDRPAVERLVDEWALEDVVEVMGFAAAGDVDAALARALCMVLPSRREGYGLVVVEASSHGTPSVVVSDPDNAATELVDDGENGVVAASASPEALANAILRVHHEGPRLRESTAAWFERNAGRLSAERSVDAVVSSYAGAM